MLEFKAAIHENELETKAKEALQQIAERKYLTAFSQRGIETIWQYGIAFCGKKICVMRA